MNQTTLPMSGPGRFQWNAGGWFGSQIGGTARLLAGAVFLFSQSVLISLTWLVCFVLANALGFTIWSRRTVVAPFKGIQLLMLTLALSGFLSWFALTWFRPDLVSALHARTQMGYQALLIFPIMMAWFYCLESGAVRLSANES